MSARSGLEGGCWVSRVGWEVALKVAWGLPL